MLALDYGRSQESSNSRSMAEASSSCHLQAMREGHQLPDYPQYLRTDSIGLQSLLSQGSSCVHTPGNAAVGSALLCSWGSEYFSATDRGDHAIEDRHPQEKGEAARRASLEMRQALVRVSFKTLQFMFSYCFNQYMSTTKPIPS